MILLKVIHTTNFFKDQKMKNSSTKEVKKITSTSLNIKDKDPKVDLIIYDYKVPNIIFYLGSQVYILSKEAWQAIGAPRLVPTSNYLKLDNQMLVKPIGHLSSATVDLHGVEVRLIFEVLDLEGF